jgi:hypothetical protein
LRASKEKNSKNLEIDEQNKITEESEDLNKKNIITINFTEEESQKIDRENMVHLTDY